MSLIAFIGYELTSTSGWKAISSSKIRGIRFCFSKLSATLIFNKRIQTDQPVFRQSCTVVIRPIIMALLGRQVTLSLFYWCRRFYPG